MKKLLVSAIVSIALLAALPVKAQTNTTATPASFLNTVEGYFTTFNTNLTNTFSTNQPYEGFVGASYQSGVFLGGTVGFEGQPFSGGFHGLTLREVSTLAPQVGTLAGQEFDLGWSITHVDTRLTIFAGCDWNVNPNSSAKAAFGVEVQKALTANTFAGIYVEGETHNGPTGDLIVGLQTGFTF